jgi:hypothetical protein
MRLPSRSRIGDGVRAAAAISLNDDIENAHEAAEMLWEMATRAGFDAPADMQKKLKRKDITGEGAAASLVLFAGLRACR